MHKINYPILFRDFVLLYMYVQLVSVEGGGALCHSCVLGVGQVTWPVYLDHCHLPWLYSLIMYTAVQYNAYNYY